MSKEAFVELHPVTLGDLESDEKGTGARRTEADKVPYELIPVRTLLEIWGRDLRGVEVGSMTALAEFQEGDDNAIYDAIRIADGTGLAAEVLRYGTSKYKLWNWAKGMPWSVCIGCALRHLQAIAFGEKIDFDSGLPHLGHYVCNLIFLAHYIEHYKEGDDRPKIFWSYYV